MQLDRDEMTPVIHRIKRAQGQLAGVLRLLESLARTPIATPTQHLERSLSWPQSTG